MKRPPFQAAVSAELSRARSAHAPQTSLHESYAVILEELDELWDECRKKASKRDPAAVLKELVQIAAMAQRAAEDLHLISR